MEFILTFDFILKNFIDLVVSQRNNHATYFTPEKSYESTCGEYSKNFPSNIKQEGTASVQKIIEKSMKLKCLQFYRSAIKADIEDRINLWETCRVNKFDYNSIEIKFLLTLTTTKAKTPYFPDTRKV